MRRQIVAGNWKMNKISDEARSYINELLQIWTKDKKEASIMLVLPTVHLHFARELEQHGILVAAQNFHWAKAGAYTGEISASMIVAEGASAVLIGHSERRQIFHEDSALIKSKIMSALDAGLLAVYCCGEKEEQRTKGEHIDTVLAQLEEELSDVSLHDWGSIIIAYEPIWAIGTGNQATAAQAQEMHGAIRNWLQLKDPSLGEHVTILYGGSCNAENASTLFGQLDVDGGLIGGASLNLEEFWAVYKTLI